MSVVMIIAFVSPDFQPLSWKEFRKVQGEFSSGGTAVEIPPEYTPKLMNTCSFMSFNKAA